MKNKKGEPVKKVNLTRREVGEVGNLTTKKIFIGYARNQITDIFLRSMQFGLDTRFSMPVPKEGMDLTDLMDEMISAFGVEEKVVKRELADFHKKVEEREDKKREEMERKEALEVAGRYVNKAIDVLEGLDLPFFIRPKETMINSQGFLTCARETIISEIAEELKKKEEEEKDGQK